MMAHLVSWFGKAFIVNAAHDILGVPHGPIRYPHIHQIETEILVPAVRALLFQNGILLALLALLAHDFTRRTYLSHQIQV